MTPTPLPKRTVYLADDDADDRLLFEEALTEIAGDLDLTVVKNGEQLMTFLANNPLPHLIFLDLNMPLKNGFECLHEIKEDEKYKHVTVVIVSTSCQEEAINKVYSKGADFYICKPDSFQKLKNLLNHVITANITAPGTRPSREEFVRMG